MRGMLLPFVALLALNLPGGNPSAGPTEPVSDTVAIQLFQFKPTVLEIAPGTTVTWTNGDGIEHTVTAGVPDSAAGDFGGALPTRGSAWSRKFEKAGTYPYYCSRHTSMRGEIRVTTTGGK